MPSIAETLEAPYFWASFVTGPGLFAARDADAAGRLVILATRAPGFLGLETETDADGRGVTRTFWRDPVAIDAWKTGADQVLRETHGLKSWYLAFGLEIGKVERHKLFKWIKRAA